VLTQQYFVATLLDLGRRPEALVRARRAVALAPRDPESSRLLAASFLANGRPDSARGVWPAFERAGGSVFERWLLAATTFAAAGMPDSAWAAWRRAEALLPADTTDLRRLGEARRVVEQTVSGR
jgi:cytochrome c-type biogenesis protein CcmH/NrfG